MAKGAYTFLAYPESSDIEKIKIALSAMSCDFSISPLHDSDVNSDGSPKKPHYHIICGFRKGLPDYKTFKENITEIGGVVPPVSVCEVRDVESAEEYQSHSENAKASEGKAKYNEQDIYHSEGWNVSCYITYSAFRDKKKDKNLEILQEIIKFISQTKCSYASLVDNFIEKKDYLAVIFKESYAINAYIKSNQKGE